MAELERAELVYTSRLHAVLPCLAFGTPLVFPYENLKRIFQPQRLSLLDSLRFEYGVVNTIDVTRFAQRYLDFASGGVEYPNLIGR